MSKEQTQPKPKKLRKPTAIEISLLWLISLAIMFVGAVQLGGQLQRNSDALIKSERAAAVEQYKSELK